MKNLMLIFASIFMFFGLMPAAQAICSNTNIISTTITVAPVRYTVNFGDVILQKDSPVGTVLKSVKTGYNANDYYGSCKNGGYMYGNMTYGGGIPSGVEHVYKTNVPGIGIKAVANSVYLDSPRSIFQSTSVIGWFYTATASVVSLVIIGPVTPGSVDPGEVGYQSFDGAPNSRAYSIALGSSTNVIATSCSILTPSINIKLDDVLSSDLKTVGKTAKLKNFSIGLDCEASAKVNVKLTGNKNTDTRASGVLQLTNAGSEGVAKGVGIQMLYNNAPMILDKNVLLKTSAGGIETFTFGAQYYQTKSDVSMGSANATATLEVTYQ